MRFESPLWLLAFIPVIILWIYKLKFRSIPTIKFPSIEFFHQLENKHSKFYSRISRYIRFMILVLVVLILARPQLIQVEKEVSSKGIDIMLVLDTSRSMAAEDFKPHNRLMVAKETIREFVAQRTTDRLGLVVFGGDAFTQCPLTTDYKVLLNFFEDIDFNMAGNGTAIGTSIATALNRLKDSKSKSKIIILLTDGENNSGEIDPIKAAELANTLGVKIYTVGVGQEGGAPVPYMHPVYGKIYSDQLTYLDEKTLTEVASITKGFYFRAKDAESLKNIYEKINQLEKTDIKTKKYVTYHDLFPGLLYVVLSLILIELFVFNIALVVTP